MDKREFFDKLLWCAGADDTINIRAITGNVIRNEFVKISELDPDAIIAKYPDQNIYFGVNPRRRGGGTKAGVTQLVALYADIDYKDSSMAQAEKRLQEFAFKPSALISSGNGLHAYWFLKEPEAPSEMPRFENILKRLAAYLQADPAAAEAARVLRMPGSFNQKNTPPAPVELVALADGNGYLLDDFDDLLPPLPRQEKAGSGAGWEEDLLKGVHKGQRTTAATRLAGRYIAKGLSDDEIYMLLAPWNELNAPPLTEDELWTVIKGIRETDSRGKTDKKSKTDNPYLMDEQGFLCHLKPIKNNQFVPVRLANFSARIVEDIQEDDGAEIRRRYAIEGDRGGRRLPRIEIPATAFSAMNWVDGNWGTLADILPGQATKDHVRYAIRLLSPDIKMTRCYTHTGWRQVGGQWVYLSGQGAIGAANVEVRLPDELVRYALPLTPEKEQEAIRASLDFLDIQRGGRELVLPLWVLTYMAALTSLLDPRPNFSLYLYGQTGTFKTTLAMLLLSHFGTFTGIEGLSNFDDTANALERRAFILKDALMVMDDFHPTTRRIDSQDKEGKVQRLIRAFSNRTARHRLNSDSTEKRSYPPRGMLLVTGEELVTLQSTLARVLVVETGDGLIDLGRLTEIQGRAAMLPHAMASFLLWTRGRIDQIQREFPGLWQHLRSENTGEGMHRKMPEAIAFLQYTLMTTLLWLTEKKAITDEAAAQLHEEGRGIFRTLAERHSRLILEEDPIKKLEDIFEALLLQGRARLEHTCGFGRSLGSGNDLIGYYDDAAVYLLPEPFWNAVSRYCTAAGGHFPFGKRTIYTMLRARGMIRKGASGESTRPIRLGGKVHRVVEIIGGGMFEFAVTDVTDEKM